MKQQRTFLLLSVIVAVLVLGVAYAAITSVTLNINGNVLASAEQGNFKVAFATNPTFDGTGTATVKVTSDTTATMDISGLSSVGDTMVVTYTIKNSSTDLWANLTNSVTNNNPEYFSVTAEFDGFYNDGYNSWDYGSYVGYRIAPWDTMDLKVTVRLLKTPITEQKATIGVKVVASPDYAS